MKLGEGIEWALHCCVLLHLADRPVPATRLAAFHDVSPSYLAKHLQSLARVGIVESTQGKGGGYRLARAAAQIRVLDVVEAVDGAQPPFTCTELRQRGPCGAPAEACTAPCGIDAVMQSADRAWRESLAAVSVAELARRADRTRAGDGSGVLRGARNWLADAR